MAAKKPKKKVSRKKPPQVAVARAIDDYWPEPPERKQPMVWSATMSYWTRLVLLILLAGIAIYWTNKIFPAKAADSKVAMVRMMYNQNGLVAGKTVVTPDNETWEVDHISISSRDVGPGKVIITTQTFAHRIGR